MSLNNQGLIGVVAWLVKGRYRLGQDELQGYLILFDPHAQTHDRQSLTVCPLSRQVVPFGSSHITASQKVQMNMSDLICKTNDTSTDERTRCVYAPRLETRVQGSVIRLWLSQLWKWDPVLYHSVAHH